MIDMNLDNLWRHPLQSPETNNAITKTAFEIAKNIVKTSVDYRVLNENSLNKFETATSIFEHSDLSTLTKVFRFDFKNLIYSEKYKRAPRLTNLLRFCEGLNCTFVFKDISGRR